MFSHWPIRKKLILGVVLLLLTVAALSGSSFMGVYAFRGLAKSIRMRAPELRFGASLARHVSELQVTYDLYNKSIAQSDVFPFEESPVGDLPIDAFLDIDGLINTQFQLTLDKVTSSFQAYRSKFEENYGRSLYQQIGVHSNEKADVERFQRILDEITLSGDLDNFGSPELKSKLETLGKLSEQLPEYIYTRMIGFADEVRVQYRSWIVLTAMMAFLSICLLLLALHVFYLWVFQPLRVLVKGSRLVAAGDFQHQIQLESKDEMAELASAMNSMTNRFREIRDDLDRQVKERTKEVVRSEQLASVGFLAAGVAHEINNPLASIAMCAESLETRVSEMLTDGDVPSPPHADEGVAVVRDYLKMIQEEAFRCKEITSRLLDFSRLGDVEKQHTDLVEITQSVIDTVKHLGKYKEKSIEFVPSHGVYAAVNAQEMKQVMLNLLTNALDSLDAGGTVHVHVDIDHAQRRGVMVVQDNGCGMTDEVQQHLFEPFFTRRRDGQGTGLGMSITYRIIHDHGGHILAQSDGPGQGSRITISLPLADDEQDQDSQTRTAA